MNNKKINLLMYQYIFIYEKIYSKGTEIGKCFEYIFASSYIYDANGIPIWPANVINYTSKTQ